MSTETRDALREALVTALSVALHEEADPKCTGTPPYDETVARARRVADDVLRMPNVVAALRATDAPVAEGLRGCPPGECTHCDRDRAFALRATDCPHCGRSLDPRPYDANRDEPTALARPEPDA